MYTWLLINQCCLLILIDLREQRCDDGLFKPTPTLSGKQTHTSDIFNLFKTFFLQTRECRKSFVTHCLFSHLLSFSATQWLQFAHARYERWQWNQNVLRSSYLQFSSSTSLDIETANRRFTVKLPEHQCYYHIWCVNVFIILFFVVFLGLCIITPRKVLWHFISSLFANADINIMH